MFRAWGLTALSFLLASTAALANAELDRIYALETIGFLPAYDNVDGLFRDYVSDAYKTYFAKQSRFVLQDLSKAGAALTSSKLPYYKVIDDVDILGQVARSTRSESMLRTKIQKEGAIYHFNMDWMHSPQMEILASESFDLKEPHNGTPIASGDINAELGHALDRLIGKVPFIGQITGRDNNSITVNIGANFGLKKGDQLLIGTLDEVKKHPLLRAIVDWRITQVGKIEIDNADEAIAFGHVIEEQPGRTLARYQKITQVIPLPENSTAVIQEKPEVNPDETPKNGWVSGELWPGSFTRQFAYSSPTNGVSSGDAGSGIFLGARAQAELWFNRDIFANLGFGYGAASYSQNDLVLGTPTAAGGVSAHVTTFKLDVGYSYLVSGDFFGPKGWAKLGYRGISYDLPPLASENTAPISFKGLFIAVGGDLPIRSGYGATINIDFGILDGGSDSSTAIGTVNSGSDVEFYVGGYYQYTPRIRFTLGFDILANSASYTIANSQIPSSSAVIGNLNQKIISILPGIVYYF